MKLTDDRDDDEKKQDFESNLMRNIVKKRGGRLKLTLELKEEIEAEIFSDFRNETYMDDSNLVRFIKEIVAPAIFKILEKGE